MRRAGVALPFVVPSERVGGPSHGCQSARERVQRNRPGIPAGPVGKVGGGGYMPNPDPAVFSVTVEPCPGADPNKRTVFGT